MNTLQAKAFSSWLGTHHPVDRTRVLALFPEWEEQLRKACRHVSHRPARAQETFEHLATELVRVAAHLLPEFHEQAAWVFLAAGNSSFAARRLSAARQAEAEHALAVNDPHVDETFTKFAKAGVLPAKAVAEYSKELSTRLTPEAAFRRFARVSVSRTEANLAPSAQMAAAIKRLARAAGDAPVREQGYLAEILALPSVIDAPVSWWEAHHEALVMLARRDPSVRGALLNLTPDWPRSDKPIEQHRALMVHWIALLEETSATAGLGDDPNVTDRERPTDGTAGWLARILKSWSSGGDDPRLPGLHALVERVADRLRGELAASGAAVELTGSLTYDLDLVDLLLSLDIPVRPTEPGIGYLDASLWSRAPERRDLRALAEHPTLAACLYKGLQPIHDNDDGRRTLRALAATSGGRSLLTGWVREQARGAWPAGLPNLPHAQRHLTWVPPEILALASENVFAACAVDPAPELVRTLRGGLFDELCLPEAESLAAGHDGTPPAFFDAWPHLIVANGTEARVIGSRGTILTHRIRSRQEDMWTGRRGFHFVDGALLVFWTQRHEDLLLGYWHFPQEEDEVCEDSNPPLSLTGDTDEFERRRGEVSLPFPGGGRFTGRGILRMGDTTIPREAAVSGDGVSLWAWDRGSSLWFSHDPATGARRDKATPPFLLTDVGPRLAWDAQPGWVRPAPSDEATPVGVPVDGLLGWRVTEIDGGLLRGEDLAGRTVTISRTVLDGPFTIDFFGALTLPGDDRPRGLIRHRLGYRAVVDPDGVITATADSAFLSEGRVLPPTSFWHLMRPRDPAGSAALREIDHATASALLDAAAHADDAALPARVRRLIPRVEDDTLAAGVARVIRFVEQRQTSMRSVADRLTRHLRDGPPDEADDPRDDPGDRLLAHALSGLSLWRGISRPDVFTLNDPRACAQLRVLAATLRENMTDSKAPDDADVRLHIGRTKIPASLISVPDLVAAAPAIGVRACAPTTSAAERDALHRLLNLVHALGPAGERAGTWRRVTVHVRREALTDAGWENEDAASSRGVLPLGDGAFLFVAGASVPLEVRRDAKNYGCDFEALHRDPSGEFKLPSAYRVDSSVELDLAAIAAAAHPALRDGRPPFAWDQAGADELHAVTGIGHAASRLVVAGLPEVEDTDFPSAELRGLLGLKEGEARLARHEIVRLASPTTRAELVTALLPQDPERLWTDGVDVSAAAKLWNRRVGRLKPIPDDLLVEATAAMPNLLWRDEGRLTATMLALRALLDPTKSPDLARTRTRTVLRGSRLRPWKDDDKTGFGGEILPALVSVASWLAHRLPAGHALRASLPVALTLLRERLAEPGTLLDLDHNAHLGAFRTAAGPPTETDEVWERHGAVVMTRGLDWDLHPNIMSSPIVRTDLLDADGRDPYLTLLLSTLPEFAQDYQRGTAFRRVYDADFAASLADPGDPVAGERDPDGTWWPQDPTRSVPDLVTEVAACLSLAPDAAAFYLMLLALPDPTDRNVARWTGWKRPRLTAAATELTEREDLVLRARRARAGRSLFLPGPWTANKAPYAALETWKLPFFDPMATMGIVGTPILGAIVPREPAPTLLHRAWQRVLDDDAPRYEEKPTP
ncbi:DNA-binding protein [Embleya sp. NPDC001921]